MEAAPIRDEVLDFTRACEALAEFAHAHNGLTTFERDTVINFVRALEEEVGPFSPAPSPEDQSTGMTKSEADEIQLRWTQQGRLPLCEHLKVELEQTEGGDVSGTYRCTTCGEVVPS